MRGSLRATAARPIAPKAAANGVSDATHDEHAVHVPGHACEANAVAPTAPAPITNERTESADGFFIASVRT